MKRRALFSIVVCLLSSWSAAAISLKVNGQRYDKLPLKVGQESLIEIHSEDNLPYTAYVGFDHGTAPLGSLSHPVVFSQAGNLAGISPVAAPPLYGYYVNAAGISPTPTAGLHFRFTYGAETVGQTVLKLYDSTFSTVLDSIIISVETETTGTGFTYQGRLLDGNQSAEGFYDFVFTLFSTPSEGTVIGTAITLEDVEVVDGYFTVQLDFGDVFGSKAQWLQMSVRLGDSTGDYTTLVPRQRLTPAPHAAYAAKSDWDNLDNIPAGFADGIDNAGLSMETDPTVPISIKDGLSWTEILGVPAGFADGVDHGLLTETDPTVPASIKDGLSWSEISSLPAGFADGVDNDTILSESQVESFIVNDITTGYVPYDNGTRLVTSPFYTNGLETAIGSAIYPDRKLSVRTDSDLYGFYSDNTKISGENFGIVGAATGNTAGSSYGLFGAATSASGTNYGVYGTSTATSTGTNYGVYGSAANTSGGAYAGYFNGDVRTTGILNKDYDLRIAADAGAEVAVGTSIDSIRKLNLYTNTDTYGIFSENAFTGGEKFGIFGISTGNTSGYSYGVYGKSSSGLGYNFGIWGEASTATAYTNYGVFGTASNSSGDAFAGYFMGDVRITNILNKDYDLAMATEDGAEIGIGEAALSDRKLYVYTNTDTYGLYSAISGGNPLIGGFKYGLYGSSSSTACTNYGVYGKAATDNPNTNYGVYGYANNAGGGAAYAGYFEGHAHVTGHLFVVGNISGQSFTDRTPYPKDLATAYDAVMSMERLPEGLYQEDNKEQQLDHSKLNAFIQSQDGKRDLSATVSCLNEVVKDLIKENQELKKRLAAVEAAMSKNKAGGKE